VQGRSRFDREHERWPSESAPSIVRPDVKRFEILGTGKALPERVVTNLDLEQMVDTSDAWIKERTGIAQRHVADAETSTSTLGAEALRNACKQAGIEPDDLDAIVLATSTPDTMFPSTACWVQKRLGISGMPAFDVGAGCTGWLYALEVAVSLLQGGSYQRIGVVGAEVMSKVVDWTDRSTCVLFGDGAGAAIIGPTQQDRGLLASNWGADGNLAPILYQPAGGTRMPASQETVAARLHSVHMEGTAVFKHAVTAMAEAGRKAIADSGLRIDQIDLLIPHQANIRIMNACRERLRVPEYKMFSVVDRYGNMSAATIPVALHDAREAGRIRDGSVVAMAAFGTGLTWAGAVLRW
jgi:3-oxoacyl-[acyl-carrier-protein] synthase-3